MRRLNWAEQRAGWKLRRTARSLDKNDSTAQGCGCGSARKVNSRIFCGANWKNERNEIKLRKSLELSAFAGRKTAALKGGTTLGPLMAESSACPQRLIGSRPKGRHYIKSVQVGVWEARFAVRSEER